MANFPPLVADFKAQFPREFAPYGTGLDSVTDNDIQRALNDAQIQFNQGLWDTTVSVGTSTEGGIAFMYLAAHCLVLNIGEMAGGLSAIARAKGIRNVAGGVPVSSGIGQASVTYQVPPPRVAENAVFIHLFQTTFGQRYMALLEPRLIGNLQTVSGRSPWGLLSTPPSNIDPGPV